MMQCMVVDMSPSAQMRKGVLEYCVLACVASESTYGFEIAKRLAQYPDLLTSEGTLYPLLSRLRKQGLVETVWKESDLGPPRRYYSLTHEGKKSLTSFSRAWRPFSAAVTTILQEAT